MKKLEAREYRSLTIQGILIALASWCLYIAFNERIQPEQYVLILYFVNLAIYVAQWKIKISITLIFIMLIGWTLICVTNWPGTVIPKDINIKDYSLSISSALLSLSGWMMHTFNNSRW
jgi:hypothetical protein